MNKTININLGGFFFHIDEIAYQKLKRYLESISRSLSDDPQGKNEIIADIEARISELLSEKITDTRQVVNESDIDSVIKIMGQPEDYADTEEAYSDSNYSYNRNTTSSKKLFRDGDDKFLGGVASGIAHYFDIDAIWVRLGLLALFFGAGFGIILYIILWILLPEAKTTAEKLQMEGEPVNIENIEKKIREEFNNVSENVREVANQASEKIKEGANDFSEKMHKTFSGKTQKNNGINDFLNTIGKLFMAIFKVIGKIIGIVILFISAAVILTLIIGGFSVGSLEWLNVDGNYISYPPFFQDAILPIWLLTLCSFFLIGIPFLILFILGLRILSSNIKKLNKPTSLTLLGIWIIALLAIIFTGIEYGTSYSNYGVTTQKKELNYVANDTLSIRMINDDTLLYRHNLRRSSGKEEILVNGIKKVYSSNITINVENSNSEESYFIIQKKSRGKNKLTAKKNAEKISYNFTIENNLITLDAFFLSDFKNLWKDEKVSITLFIPKNVTVFFNNSTRNFLYDVNNTSDIKDRDMAKHHFIMTETTLDCTDCITNSEAEVINEGKKKDD